MNHKDSLSLDDRLLFGFLCWVAVLVLIAVPLGDYAMIVVWPYVLVSAIAGLVYLLEGPPEKRRHRKGKPRPGADPEPEPETPKEFITRMVDETLHEATLLHEACERRPEIADQIRDMYAQKFHSEKEVTE